MQLTPDDLARLEAKQLANVIRKIQSGKSLTARESALLAQARVGGAGAAASAFAKTWDELAQRLSTTRRSLQTWRADPRYAPDAPRPEADGRLDVAAFAEWMVRHALAGADAEVQASGITHHSTLNTQLSEVIEPPPLGGSQTDWTKAVLHEKHASARLDRQTKEGTLLVAAELEIPLGVTFAAIQVKLAQYPATAARSAAGRRDVGEVEDILRGEMDIVLADLHGAAYLDLIPAEVVATLDLPEADRARLADLLTECLRRIGRRALRTGEAAPAAPSVDDASTVAAASADAESAPCPKSKALRNTGASKAEIRATRKGRKPIRKPADPPADVEAMSGARSFRKKPKRKSRR